MPLSRKRRSLKSLMTPATQQTLAECRRCLDAGQLDRAEALARGVLQGNPAEGEAFRLLGFVACYRGQYPAAADYLSRAIRLNPRKAELYENLAVIFAGAERFADAESTLRQAVAIQPNFPSAWNHLGMAIMDQGRHAEAQAAFRTAIEQRPGFVEAINHFGITQRELGDSDAALATFREAHRLDPNDGDVELNLWILRQERGEIEESVSVFDRILKREPGNAKARSQRSLSLLLLGRWREGWIDYEYRTRLKEWIRTPSAAPVWDGRPFPGQTLLMTCEQGVGDNLLALRFASMVKERGGDVLVRCRPRLFPLFETVPGVDALVSSVDNDLPPHDWQVPLMSLPRLFGLTPDSVPTPIPYLYARADLVESWREKLRAFEGFKVGIVWQGNSKFLGDRTRSIPLEKFEPLSRVPNVRLISLQVGDGIDQLGAQSFPVIDLGSELDRYHGSFMDTAAILKNLDLFISSDTSVPHLAGALGVPTWLALSFVPDWRWLLQRDDSPWFPTMRLFRQKVRGDWGEVFERMADALSRLAGTQ